MVISVSTLSGPVTLFPADGMGRRKDVSAWAHKGWLQGRSGMMLIGEYADLFDPAALADRPRTGRHAVRPRPEVGKSLTSKDLQFTTRLRDAETFSEVIFVQSTWTVRACLRHLRKHSADLLKNQLRSSIEDALNATNQD
ncbi:MAG: hypothetical protein AAGG45_00655 [Pseudomonadota bacterium]